MYWDAGGLAPRGSVSRRALAERHATGLRGTRLPPSSTVTCTEPSIPPASGVQDVCRRERGDVLAAFLRGNARVHIHGVGVWVPESNLRQFVPAHIVTVEGPDVAPAERGRGDAFCFEYPADEGAGGAPFALLEGRLAGSAQDSGGNSQPTAVVARAELEQVPQELDEAQAREHRDGVWQGDAPDVSEQVLVLVDEKVDAQAP